jgi:hypothetical protein
MYQVLETTSQHAKPEQEGLVFENSEVKITYDFWTNGGKVDFLIFNKLDAPIYINWDKSHLIFNDISYEYWLDSEQSNTLVNSSSIGSSNTASNALVSMLTGSAYGSSSTSGLFQGRRTTSVASSKYKPKRIVQIPPKSAIRASNFSISKDIYFTCEFNLKNTQKNTANQSFNTANSPIKLRNYLTYSTDPLQVKDIIVDNAFYVSKITFMNEKMFLGNLEKSNVCDVNGKKSNAQLYNLPYKNPRSFFIEFRTQVR